MDIDVFVSIPFAPEFNEVFQAISQVASERGLKAYRIDAEHLAVQIAEDIERKIRDSRFVIADVTNNNPNVLNEIGQARTLGKPLILISQDSPSEATFNIRGLRILNYSRKLLDDLKKILRRALSEATSPNEMLRAMLVPNSLGRPTQDSRFIIAASPLSYRRVMGRSGGYTKLRRTASDYVGLRGLLQAFGLLYGFGTLPDIVDPEDCADNVIREAMNLYSIASPKANRWTRKVLDQYQERWVPPLEFRAYSKSKNLKNVKVSLFSHDELVRPDGWQLDVNGDRYARDFGLIVRGPNPYPHNESYMVTILAGRSSLGTEAACRAFTDPDKIEEIRQLLSGSGIDLEDHKQAFWAIVSMDRAIGDKWEEAIIDSLKVEKANAFKPKY